MPTKAPSADKITVYRTTYPDVAGGDRVGAVARIDGALVPIIAENIEHVRRLASGADFSPFINRIQALEVVASTAEQKAALTGFPTAPSADNPFVTKDGLGTLRLPEEGQGILPGVGDSTISEFVEAPVVTADGSASVSLTRSWYVFQGVSYRVTETHALELNQLDGDGQGLAAGEEYTARLVQSKGDGITEIGPVVVKGARAVIGSSVLPDLPALSLSIGQVTVYYRVGGTSIISQSDVLQTAVNGRGKPTVGVGLSVIIGTLRARLAGALVAISTVTEVPVTANFNNRIWLKPDGTFVAVADDSPYVNPPVSGALLICDAVGGPSSVTSIQDDRIFWEPNAQVIVFGVVGAESRLMKVEKRWRERLYIPSGVTTIYTSADLGLGANVRISAVATNCVVVPAGPVNFDVGVDGDTQRFDAAVGLSVSGISVGMKDFSRLYLWPSPQILITFNAPTTDANGIIDVTVFFEEVNYDADDRIRAAIPYSYNIDRVIAYVGTPASPIGGGQTIFNLLLTRNQMNIFPDSGRPTIPAGEKFDMNAYPLITLGKAGDSLLYHMPEASGGYSSASGGGNGARSLYVALVIYPTQVA